MTGSVVFAGVPISWLLNGRRPLARTELVQAPFLDALKILPVGTKM